MKIDKEKYIDSGLVTERVHPTEPYIIYNYTHLCQNSGAWDEVTTQCRGLIVHKDTGEIIARPFSKFFNYEEHIQKGHPIPNEEPVVYDKRDGSLGILYWGIDGKPYIATRGSFTSDQALWATDFFRKHCDFMDWNKEYTHLFEIIYPQNRIVVDYGKYEGLDLLAILDTKTGKHIPMTPAITALGRPITPIPFTNFDELKALNLKNSEGFVLHFVKADLRLKIKFEDYIRLHRIITGLSEKSVWEMMRDGKGLIEILKDIPDEMYPWTKSIVDDLFIKFTEIENTSKEIASSVRNLTTRKEQAEIVKIHPYSSVIFNMLAGKDYKFVIWKMIKPKGSSTFRNDIDT